MSGDQPRVLLIAERDTVLARAVEALGRFPTGQGWVLIGGVAVFLRVGTVTRPTADADTVARSQAELIQQLVNDGITTIVAGGDIRVPVGDGTVDIDVMDLADDPLPLDVDRRTFALARRCALATSVTEQIIVTDRNHTVIVEAMIPVATVSALTALKTVSMLRRPHGKHPHKVGSDIHDLVRLVAAGGPRDIATGLVTFDVELATWIAEQVGRAFGDDLRYTLLRLRQYDRSPAAQALTDEEIAATGILADVIHQQLLDR